MMRIVTAHFIKSSLLVQPTADLCTLEWGHGPSHVFGGVELVFATTEPGAWWRSSAQAHAVALVRATGGTVADDHGLVRLVVPEHWAVRVHEKMAAQCRDLTGRYDASANEARLVTAGVARWVPVMPESADLELALAPLPQGDVYSPDSHGGFAMVVVRRGIEEEKAVAAVHYADGTVQEVRVPISWALNDNFQAHTYAALRNEMRPEYNREATPSDDV
jgi:hypothetical protein